ncbi:glycoside hydrolase family 3 protein [Curtobacterium sp. SL109]|uniref:glycoside hydrolase family 3 protein n=1 Tax=Curtobacterium sp. SL109 TaxID=2994662 RepID=UPI002273BB6C|nr:glycoside hydrolase family 3 N-terminal domain-containing protein [Curtobacterium sp. SL109]MCY1693727.1 glycoside hydrolase family 3 C-terminal domain-containing protein [Curtobacterium sp. SL109]
MRALSPALPTGRRVLGIAAGAAVLATVGIASVNISPAIAADQPVLGAKSAPIITVDGLQFRDLDRNGQLTPYEDWRLTDKERAADLVSRLDLSQRAGTLVHADLNNNAAKTAYDMPSYTTMVQNSHITTYISRLAGGADSLATQNNALQETAEAQPFGIPVKISTDPRSGFSVTDGQSVSNGDFTPFPDAIGMGAVGDEQLTKQMGEIIAQEYRAVGFTEALSPQADISTEPRWSRQNGTFGSVGTTVKGQVRAYIEGMQGSDTGLTKDGVATVVKHWVGYGAQENGYDSHYYYGRYATFPGNNFDEHLIPFEGAFDANASGVMPTYSILKDLQINGKTIEQVGAGHNEYLLQDLLRGKYGFDGVITSDWGIVNDCPQECQSKRPPESFRYNGSNYGMPWGVEGLSLPERYASAINAGVDIIGGTNQPQYIVQAVDQGLLSEQRVNEAAERVLEQKFQLGLFENPYVDAAAAKATVGSAAHRAVGIEAQERSLTLLTNEDNALPLTNTAGKKVYLNGIQPAAVADTGLSVVTDPTKADIALVRLSDPAGGSDLTDLNFTGTEPAFVALKAAHDAGATTIALPQLSRPLILGNVVANSDAVLANYGVSDQALIAAVTGKTEPAGKLPFELPSSMDAVKAQYSDVPNDSANPLFKYGFGLAYADVTEPTDPPTTGTPTPTPTPEPTSEPTGEPTATPTAKPTAAPVPDSELTDANRGDVAVPATAQRGETIAVHLGKQAAGTKVSIWLHSTPVLLASPTVNADGSTTVQIPPNATLGAHRIVVQNADGTLYGWDDLRIVSAAGAGTDSATGDNGPLAYTGTDVLPWASGAAILLLLGAALLITQRRRNRSTNTNNNTNQ